MTTFEKVERKLDFLESPLNKSYRFGISIDRVEFGNFDT